MKQVEEMREVTEEEFQANFDNYMDLIENQGEHFLVRRPDGSAVIAAPSQKRSNHCLTLCLTCPMMMTFLEIPPTNENPS